MITISDFGKLDNGTMIKSLTMTSGQYSVELLSLGATIRKINVPDKEGNIGDVVLGFDTPQEYLDSDTYFGMIVGPFANRIGGASFTINNKAYHIEPNDNKVNSLHSGSVGFNWKVWSWEKTIFSHREAVCLTSVLKDGEGNWPGEITIQVYYTLSEEGALSIHYRAVSDSDVYLNFTNHSYFNLTADAHQTILSHEVQTDADYYLENDDLLIPTGTLIPTENNAFDFHSFHAIGERIEEAGGYDHCFTFPQQDGSLKKRLTLQDPKSGRVMDVYTTMPAIQMYSGNALSSAVVNKHHIPLQPYAGVALETEFYPDSPNKPQFPSCLYKKGEVYQETTIYQFRK